MTDEIIVAVFDAASRAEAAVADLRAARVPEDAIELHAGGATAEPRGQGFWASLFGGEPEHGTALYDHSLRQGSTVLTVRTPSELVDRVMQLLERHHPTDMEDRATADGLATASGTATGLSSGPAPGLAPMPLPPAMAGTPRAPALAPRYEDAAIAREEDADATRTDATGDVMQLSEERLEVGKRLVNRGGTRIRRYVVETPVEQSVTLREEHVTLDRHPVADGRPVAADAFADKAVEMVETAEEAVVSKTARVVEEVSLRRQASERVETVRDTVRRQEVAVEQIPGTATSETLPPRPRAPRA